MCADYRSWVLKPAVIPDKMISIYERFLLRSLATDSSLMGYDCIETLSLSNSSIAKGYLVRLKEIGLNPNFLESSEEVERYLEEMDGNPWDQSPFLVLTRSDNSKLLSQVKSLSEYREVASSKAVIEVAPMVKRRFQEVDGLFRHLRNALAHGCFRYIADSESLFFFDLKSNKTGVSCVGLEPLKVLNAWYGVSCEFAEDRL